MPRALQLCITVLLVVATIGLAVGSVYAALHDAWDAAGTLVTVWLAAIGCIAYLVRQPDNASARSGPSAGEAERSAPMRPTPAPVKRPNADAIATGDVFATEVIDHVAALAKSHHGIQYSVPDWTGKTRFLIWLCNTSTDTKVGIDVAAPTNSAEEHAELIARTRRKLSIAGQVDRAIVVTPAPADGSHYYQPAPIEVRFWLPTSTRSTEILDATILRTLGIEPEQAVS